MKKTSVLLLAGALILAAGVALLARVLLTPPPPQVVTVALTKAEPEPPPPVSTHGAILVVSDTLRPGDFIDGSRVAWRESEGEPDPGIAFVRGRDTREALYGATVRQPVEAGRPLPAGLVVRQGEPGFLAAILKPGLRAVSVPTGVVESSFGLVSSGDVVDVILALKRSDNAVPRAQAATSPYLAAQTILHGVRVLALNNQVRGDSPVRPDNTARKAAGERGEPGSVDSNAQTVTLEVTPGDAEKLAVAKEIGTLQLALRPARNPDPGEPPAAKGITTVQETTDLYAASPHAAASPHSVRAFRGEKSEILSLNAQ